MADAAAPQAVVIKNVVPQGGKVFLSVSDQHKREVVSVAKQFADLGFELIATNGTAAVLARYETAVRPENLRWNDWTAGQLDKVTCGLAELERRAAGFGA